ncbi:hypothetical protein L1987_22469 [Smallanthus sonchifolius]|uniref:Uncharacterized protein n=1 Tax=Smallanthus sonchifolius TaxID=185202 RepID=A0ACB9IGE6_9ASTR|nr:hypothetical protein L1987_22469 [Smallanthus sonchifolius]
MQNRNNNDGSRTVDYIKWRPMADSNGVGGTDFYTRFEVTFVISPSPPSSLLFSSLMTNEFTHSYLIISR